MLTETGPEMAFANNAMLPSRILSSRQINAIESAIKYIILSSRMYLTRMIGLLILLRVVHFIELSFSIISYALRDGTDTSAKINQK